MVIAKLAADDAVDILKEITKDEVASFLAIMEKQPAEEIKALLHYEEKTAGSIMTTEYIAFIKTQTVKETMKEMKVKAPDAETIYYTYVLDESKRLAGVVSLRDLIDRKSTRLNSSHVSISYAVFCLNKQKKK